MEKRVYYHDTDAGGVVYYGNYLKFLEEARTEFIEQRGVSVKESASSGFLYAVRQCNTTYKAPARYGDIIECTAQLEKISAAQIFFKQTVIRKSDQLLLVTANVTLVCLTKNFKPSIIPENIRAKLLS